MVVSDAVKAALERAAALDELLFRKRLKVRFENARERLAVTSLALALAHRDGIQILIHSGAPAPAFALLRPMYEAMTRGVWAATCATDQQGEHAYQKGYLPKFDTIVKALDRKQAHGGIYGRLRVAVWDGYSDYAHGGMRQINRWVGKNVSAPSHDDDDLLDLIHFVSMHTIQVHMAFADIAGGQLSFFGDLATTLTNSMKARKGLAKNP